MRHIGERTMLHIHNNIIHKNLAQQDGDERSYGGSVTVQLAPSWYYYYFSQTQRFHHVNLSFFVRPLIVSRVL